jgi:crotonobetainyl-CoA:carnitine CoA-transferase CaiB-like acyl-CoA transferase
LTDALEGVRVLEYGTGIGVGYCGALLAGLGARVEKIATQKAADGPGPAGLRNRAEAIFLDADKTIIDEEVGGESFRRRFAEAKVVLRGYDPSEGEAPQIREEYERWRHGDNLIFVAVTPFGVSGPASRWHGGDLQAQSLSGWTWITGMPGEAPLSMNYGIGALQHGLNAAGAAVAALLATGDGGGEFVDVSEADVIAATMRMYSLVYRFLGIPLKRGGLRAPGSSGRYPHTVLPCKDGYISVICRSNQDWDRFLAMMGNPSWGDEPRYRDFYAMGTEYADEVDALVIPWLMERTKEELSALATEYKVPLAPVRTTKEVMRDPQFAYRHFFRWRTDGNTSIQVPGQVALWTATGEANG